MASSSAATGGSMDGDDVGGLRQCGGSDRRWGSFRSASSSSPAPVATVAPGAAAASSPQRPSFSLSMRRFFGQGRRRRRRPSTHDTGGIGHEQPPSPSQSPPPLASGRIIAGGGSPRTPPLSGRLPEGAHGTGGAGGSGRGLLDRLALGSPVRAGSGDEGEGQDSVRTLGSVLPTSRQSVEDLPLAWLRAAAADGAPPAEGEGSDGGYYGMALVGDRGTLTPPMTSRLSSSNASGTLGSPGVSPARRTSSKRLPAALSPPHTPPPPPPPALHSLPTLLQNAPAPLTEEVMAGRLLPPTPPRRMQFLDRASREEGLGLLLEGQASDGGLDDGPSTRPSEATAPGEDDGTAWSDDGTGAGGGGCGAERCVRERRHLLRLAAELRARVEAGEAVMRRQRREVLDLRQQVAMLSGCLWPPPGQRGGGGGRGNMQPQYVGSYDVVVPRANGGGGGRSLGSAAVSSASAGAVPTAAAIGVAGGARPAASAASLVTGGSRVRLAGQGRARINPALIIQEKDIVIEKIVGVGSFGKVWKGVYAGRPVAIKCFYSEDADVIAEIQLMERVSGKPHVLPLEGVYLSNASGEEAQVALVTPYMENGSLHDVLVNRRAPQHRAGAVSMNAIVKMALQAADGVRALHREGVIHRDLACRNLLVDGHLNVYVSDFGFARQKENLSSKGFTKNNMGPVKWEAPESLQHKEYSEKTDAFSFAVCLYEMVSGKEPWEHETHAQVAYQVIGGQRLPIALNCDPTLAELMKLCWAQDPRRRPNFEYIYRRLKERHTELQNEEREITLEKGLVADLRRGTTFYKLPYLKGKPHKRQFKVSEDLRRLKWCFLPARNLLMQRARDPVRPATKQVFLREVQDIRMGMRTANFKRLVGLALLASGAPEGGPQRRRQQASPQPLPHHLQQLQASAFSIVTQDRTIDVLCPSPEVMDRWVLGLRFLVERLRPPPPAFPAAAMDHWAVMARLRRGGFLLKFGQIGRPHERYFRISANMRQMLWAAGDPRACAASVAGGGIALEHKAVDLAAIHGVRLFRQGQPGTAAVMPSLHPFSRGVDDYQHGFSLLNAQGQAELNVVAPNAQEYALWTRGFELIVRHFQDQDAEARALAQHAALEEAERAEEAEGEGADGEGGEGAGMGQRRRASPAMAVYDRVDYLAFQPLKDQSDDGGASCPVMEAPAPQRPRGAASLGRWQQQQRQQLQGDGLLWGGEEQHRPPQAETTLVSQVALREAEEEEKEERNGDGRASEVAAGVVEAESGSVPGTEAEEAEEEEDGGAARMSGAAVAATTNGGGGGGLTEEEEGEVWSAPSSTRTSSHESGGPIFLPGDNGAGGTMTRGARTAQPANGTSRPRKGQREGKEEVEEEEETLPLDPQDVYASSASFLHFAHKA